MNIIHITNNGIFSQILGSNEKDLTNDFITELSTYESNDMKVFLEMYKKKVLVFQPSLSELTKIEEILLQLKAKEIVDQEMRLVLVRDKYIYARTYFYRTGKDAKDIRVIVGNVEHYGNNLNSLYNNEEFMTMAKNKLLMAMINEIDTSMENF